MIHVDRGSEPPFLRDNKVQLTVDLLTARALEARASTGPEKAAAKKQRKICEGRYNEKTVRSHLKLAFHGKCAYCESRVLHVSYLAIEHFEPKIQRPDLVFEWSNLLLSCTICNSKWKGTKFPTAAQGGPLLNPSGADVIKDHLVFQFDPKTDMTAVGWRTTRGETTVALLGLNSGERKELLEQRSERFKELWIIFKMAPTDPEAAEIWKAAVAKANEGSREYAAFVRALDRGELVFL